MVYGGKTHVLPPCFVFPSSLVNLFIVFVEVVGAVMVGSGVWQAVSPCPRVHSTRELTSRWGEQPLPFSPSSPRCHSFPGRFTICSSSSRAWSSPPPPSSSWSGSFLLAGSWSIHAHAQGSGSFLTRRAIDVSLHAWDFSSFTRVLFPHT